MKSTKWRALEKGVLHLSKGQIGQSSSSVSSVMTLWQQACKLHLWWVKSVCLQDPIQTFVTQHELPLTVA